MSKVYIAANRQSNVGRRAADRLCKYLAVVMSPAIPAVFPADAFQLRELQSSRLMVAISVDNADADGLDAEQQLASQLDVPVMEIRGSAKIAATAGPGQDGVWPAIDNPDAHVNAVAELVAQKLRRVRGTTGSSGADAEPGELSTPSSTSTTPTETSSQKTQQPAKKQPPKKQQPKTQKTLTTQSKTTATTTTKQKQQQQQQQQQQQSSGGKTKKKKTASVSDSSGGPPAKMKKTTPKKAVLDEHGVQASINRFLIDGHSSMKAFADSIAEWRRADDAVLAECNPVSKFLTRLREAFGSGDNAVDYAKLPQAMVNLSRLLSVPNDTQRELVLDLLHIIQTKSTNHTCFSAKTIGANLVLVISRSASPAVVGSASRLLTLCLSTKDFRRGVVDQLESHHDMLQPPLNHLSSAASITSHPGALASFLEAATHVAHLWENKHASVRTRVPPLKLKLQAGDLDSRLEAAVFDHTGDGGSGGSGAKAVQQHRRELLQCLRWLARLTERLENRSKHVV